MKRPLPPDLVALGDQLEAATARAVGRRRARRQLILNALVALVVAVPLGVSAAGWQTSGVATPVTVPAGPLRSAPAVVAPARATDDFPPRDLRRLRTPSSPEFLLMDSTFRPALR